MKRLFTLFFLLLCWQAHAQVIILSDNMFQGRMSEIKTTVVDSLTLEPMAFASVYVIPSKDTTITNFTLTDAQGEAKLDEVPYGGYVFHVEMMGYKPFVKERYFRERMVDMGTIKLQADEQFLQAAVVSDIGNPIVVKQDTVEFNASSFRVGANAMLKDLLQRMPGMEITEDGKVKFNGEEIDKLTVGGRTFFFNDQSTALNNLPASVVDKIRVIDRESEATRATGLQDGAREKVLDVALKKEYQEGWFGNAGLKGGATLGKKEADALRDNRGFLWSGNALVSAYSEKDQLTVIGNAQNVNDSNAVLVLIDSNGESSTLGQDLSSAAQIGINANTSRIKDVETTAGVNYKYSDADAGTRSTRTTYQQGGDLLSVTENTGKDYAHAVSANLEMEKEKGKVWFHLRPQFRYSRDNAFGAGHSETTKDGAFVNRSQNASHSLETSINTGLDSDFTLRDLGGKKDRTFTVGASGSIAMSGGSSDETSSMETLSGDESRAMQYVSDRKSYNVGGSLRYTEPIGEQWALSGSTELYYSRSFRIRDAFDAFGANDYYSSESRSHSLQQQYDLTVQYKFGERNWITLGARLSGAQVETFSKSFGIEEVTGAGEWNWFVTPTLRFLYEKGMNRISFYVSSYSQQPSASRMLPVLNIANPARLSLGNIYLKPYSNSYFSGSWTRSNQKRFSTLMVFLNGQVQVKPVSMAQWYDASGILYAIPVNAFKPGLSASVTANYTTPLDAKKLWSLSVNGSMRYSSSVSYQAKTALDGIDKESFNYATFMAAFWGGADGSRFYGGQSGFAESSPRLWSPSAGVTVKFNPDHYSFSVGVRTNGRIARYSLDPSINMNTLDTRLTARGSYTTRHEFEFNTDLSYVFYRGYADGYGQPEWQWNADVSKNIGAFNLSISVHDILNQTRNLTHTVTANYQEDTYRLMMGRYFLFGVKWNFGKMNATHSQRASQAVWNMVF